MRHRTKKTNEPARLSKGRRFHTRIQREWKIWAEGQIEPETTIPIIKRGRPAKGRVDIFVGKTSGFVTVVELKNTNWDRIRRENVVKLLGSHRRQVWRYIESFLPKGTDVCAGIIYPRPPRSRALCDQIETHLGEYGLQVVWHQE